MPTSSKTKAIPKKNALQTTFASMIRVPVEQAQSVEMRYALPSARDRFDPQNCGEYTLAKKHQRFPFLRTKSGTIETGR